MTVAETYETIIFKCADVLAQEELNFLNQRKEAYIKKTSERKPTKTQLKNEEIKKHITDSMTKGNIYTMADIQKGVGLESTQKTSALMSQLCNANLVKRDYVKGKVYFTKA